MKGEQHDHVRDIAAHAYGVEKHPVDQPRNHHRMLVVRLEENCEARVRRQDERPFIEVEGETARQPEGRGAHDHRRERDEDARMRDADFRCLHAWAVRNGPGAAFGMATIANHTATASSTGSGPRGQASSAVAATTASQARCQVGGWSWRNSQAAPARIAKSWRCQYVADIIDVSRPSVIRRARLAPRLK